MGKILVVGNITRDIVHSVDHYPQEDEEIRASSQRRQRGGNAATTAVILAQHGHQVSFAGSISADRDGRDLLTELEEGGVETAHCQVLSQGCCPLSCITHNQRTGSRTIVHFRDLAEYAVGAFSAIPLAQYDWFHFEGRNLKNLEAMLKLLQQVRVDQPISLEVEKPRSGLERLYPLADILLFSRAYAQQRGWTQVEQVFASAREICHDATLVCTWGDEGAYAQLANNRLLHQPAQPLAQIIDSVGAGDTFNAGLIHSLLSGQSTLSALAYAVALAEKKLQQFGFTGLLT